MGVTDDLNVDGDKKPQPDPTNGNVDDEAVTTTTSLSTECLEGIQSEQTP